MKLFLFTYLLSALGHTQAEDGSQAWLRYARAPSSTSFANAAARHTPPSVVLGLQAIPGSLIDTAVQELPKSLTEIVGRPVDINETSETSRSIVVGTVSAYERLEGVPFNRTSLKEDGFYLQIKESSVRILGSYHRGALYGAFQYLSRLGQGSFVQDSFVTNPKLQLRWINEWNNLDGTIERGYAGPSIVFENGHVVDNTTRVAEYARLLASLPINAVVVKNVNTKTALLSS